MVLQNPEALLVLPLVVIFILCLALWAWKAKKEILGLFLLDVKRARRSHIKKYIIEGAILVLLGLFLAQPGQIIGFSAEAGRAGEIALAIDVTRSMDARQEPEKPSRLEKVRSLLFEMVDNFSDSDSYSEEELKISLFGLTNIGRSFVPFVSKKHFPYLKKSIKEVLAANSVPGRGSNLSQAILDVLSKFSKENKAKILIVFSDGEFFNFQKGMTGQDEELLETAIRKASQEKIKIVTVGVGEKEGSTIPIYNDNGDFAGEYATDGGKIYSTRLEEGVLRKIAERTGGKYFFEKDAAELPRFIHENLSADISSVEQKEYKDISILFLIPISVLWIIFARYYLR